MGIASNLFFSSNDLEAQTLYRRITPSADQFEQQRERWNELADHLKSDLQQRSGCEIRTWLQGSYKFGTQVRPPSKVEEFDIDLGIYHCWEGQAKNGIHSASDLKTFTQQSLQAFMTGAEGVLEIVEPPKARCSRIRYSGNFHIDVPSYHLEPNQDERTLAANDVWEISDPKAIYTWFKAKFDDGRRAVARRQIKYLKCWASLRWGITKGRPSSILLTVLVAEALARLDDSEIGTDDETLLATVKEIATRLSSGSFIRNPANPSENLNRLDQSQWAAFILSIDVLLGIAQDACIAESQLEAADLWAKAFEHFFPMPEADLQQSRGALGQVQLPAVIKLPDVTVTAVSNSNRNLQFSGINKIGPIPKGCQITFTIAKAWNLPPGTTVSWSVRNEGAEAESENDLGHSGGNSFTTEERSAYAGTHYMDCIFRQSNRAIGIRRVAVTISGTYAPPRNPIKKPAYTRLAGRR
jgi:hypothetical protein